MALAPVVALTSPEALAVIIVLDLVTVIALMLDLVVAIALLPKKKNLIFLRWGTVLTRTANRSLVLRGQTIPATF